MFKTTWLYLKIMFYIKINVYVYKTYRNVPETQNATKWIKANTSGQLGSKRNLHSVPKTQMQSLQNVDLNPGNEPVRSHLIWFNTYPKLSPTRIENVLFKKLAIHKLLLEYVYGLRVETQCKTPKHTIWSN